MEFSSYLMHNGQYKSGIKKARYRVVFSKTLSVCRRIFMKGKLLIVKFTISHCFTKCKFIFKSSQNFYY
jgi:hypothetical protein